MSLRRRNDRASLTRGKGSMIPPHRNAVRRFVAPWPSTPIDYDDKNYSNRLATARIHTTTALAPASGMPIARAPI